MTIKSYVLRAGRLSQRQKLGLEKYLEHYCLPIDGKPWDLYEIFQRQAPTRVEIGFGMGASLLTMAQEHPEINFIGIEVHRAGIGALAANLYELQLNNVRIVVGDAVSVFTTQLLSASVDGVQIFFPDPWPKQKHHKRRLIQENFVILISQALRINGFLHCATDWQNYAEHILQVLAAESTFKNQSINGNYCERPVMRPLTKFEQRGKLLGHNVWDLIFYKL